MQLKLTIPDLAGLQALADSAASDAEEALLAMCQTVAQHILPRCGWDGAHTAVPDSHWPADDFLGTP